MKFKKNIISILILSSLILVSCNLQPNEKIYKAGTYKGTAQGHIGPIVVIVTTNQYEIEDIEITEEYEMPEISKHVYEKIPNKIISKNSADVDVISGETYTSRALIDSIAEALESAKIDD